jgi:hypothetical protein
MAEMSRKERILAISRKRNSDKLPFFHYWRHSQVGWAERECRNKGMGINWVRPPFTVAIQDVDISETQSKKNGQTVYRRTFRTPVGSIYYDEVRPPGVGQWHADRGWNDIVPWQTDRLIKGPDDYPVLKYIVEHTEYKADYFPIEQAMDWLGDEGVVMDGLPHSPMQMLMINWVGSEEGRFFFHYADYPDLVEETYHAICKSREPLYDIAAKSPAPVTLCGDNIDGVLVNPNLFKKYFMPVYQKQADVLHKENKLMAVHMDGRLSVIKNLITQTDIDIIEAFHPPPMGDISVGEALSLWKDKAIWIGFPGSIYELGPNSTREHMLELLRDAGDGKRLAVAMSTENIVSNENLCMLASVLEKTDLPLTPDKIDRIEASLKQV